MPSKVTISRLSWPNKYDDEKWPFLRVEGLQGPQITVNHEK